MAKVVMINDEWELEGFVTRSDANIGIKYGFACFGQGGGKIGDTFAAIKSPQTEKPVYPVVCFNTNEGDLKSLENVDKHNRIVLKGYERGAGMDPEIGKRALQENGELVFETLQRVMANVDVIFVCGTLGGGTGTGAINMAADVIADYLGKPVFAIVSLPDPHPDENVNAFEALKELVPKLEEIRGDEETGRYRALENISILDNKKIIEEHLAVTEKGDNPKIAKMPWYRYSNYKVASILHEWNVLTTLKSDKTLDAEDLKNKILFTGGVLTYAKKKINLTNNDLKSEEDLINEVVSTYRGPNVLANGFDYRNDAKAFGIHVMMPKGREDLFNSNTLEKINKRLQEELPGVPIYYGTSSANADSKYLLVYTIISLRGLPERARNLKQESEELLRIKAEREKKSSGFQLGGALDAGGSPKIARGRSVQSVPTNPFAAKSETAATKQPPNFNPFQINKRS